MVGDAAAAVDIADGVVVAVTFDVDVRIGVNAVENRGVVLVECGNQLHVIERRTPFDVAVFKDMRLAVSRVGQAAADRHHLVAYLRTRPQVDEVTRVVRQCDIHVIMAVTVERQLLLDRQLRQFLRQCNLDRGTLFKCRRADIRTVRRLRCRLVDLLVGKTDKKRFRTEVRHHLRRFAVLVKELRIFHNLRGDSPQGIDLQRKRSRFNAYERI